MARAPHDLDRRNLDQPSGAATWVPTCRRCSPRRPDDATLVVFHTAVFPYVDDAAKAAFLDAVGSSRAVWLANEAPPRVPGLDRATVDAHPHHVYLLCRDGRPLARTDPHASWIEWLR